MTAQLIELAKLSDLPRGHYDALLRTDPLPETGIVYQFTGKYTGNTLRWWAKDGQPAAIQAEKESHE